MMVLAPKPADLLKTAVQLEHPNIISPMAASEG
jgi:hypothetical protein